MGLKERNIKISTFYKWTQGNLNWKCPHLYIWGWERYETVNMHAEKRRQTQIGVFNSWDLQGANAHITTINEQSLLLSFSAQVEHISYSQLSIGWYSEFLGLLSRFSVVVSLSSHLSEALLQTNGRQLCSPLCHQRCTLLQTNGSSHCPLCMPLLT